MSKKENIQDFRTENTPIPKKENKLFGKFTEMAKQARINIGEFAKDKRFNQPPIEIAKTAINDLKSATKDIWSKFGNNKKGEPKPTPIEIKSSSILSSEQIDSFKVYTREELDNTITTTKKEIETLIGDGGIAFNERKKLEELYTLLDEFKPSESHQQVLRAMKEWHEIDEVKKSDELLSQIHDNLSDAEKSELYDNKDKLIDELIESNNKLRDDYYHENTLETVEFIPVLKISQIEEIDKNPSLLADPLLKKMYTEYERKNKVKTGLSKNHQTIHQNWNNERVIASKQEKKQDPSIIQLETFDGKINTTRSTKNPELAHNNPKVRNAIINYKSGTADRFANVGNERDWSTQAQAEYAQSSGGIAVLERPTIIAQEVDTTIQSSQLENNSEDLSKFMTTAIRRDSAPKLPDSTEKTTIPAVKRKPINWHGKVDFAPALNLLKSKVGTNPNGERNFVGRLIDIGATHVGQAKENVVSGAKSIFSSQNKESNSNEIDEERKNGIVEWLSESVTNLSPKESTQAEAEKTKMINSLSPTEIINLYKACNDSEIKLIAKYLSPENMTYFL